MVSRLSSVRIDWSCNAPFFPAAFHEGTPSLAVGLESASLVQRALKNADSAAAATTRVQRELTKSFFLHNNERVLITFSAGVAERLKGEVSDATMKRADLALYEAKHSGRNRVVGA